jgi:hypothetical protein
MQQQQQQQQSAVSIQSESLLHYQPANHKVGLTQLHTALDTLSVSRSSVVISLSFRCVITNDTVCMSVTQLPTKLDPLLPFAIT